MKPCPHASQPIPVQSTRKKRTSHYVVICAKDDKYASRRQCDACKQRRKA